MKPIAILAFAAASIAAAPPADPLPSWNDGPVKARILAFVENADEPGSDGFVPPEARIAVFDNDGTLWSEQPVYFQLLYALDRARLRAAADPAWASTPTLAAAARGDLAAVMAGGTPALVELVDATHAGLSVEAFEADVRDWLATARHPVNGRPILSMTYQPMRELLAVLEDNGFSTYIVSGGGTDFLRAFAKEAYGIERHNVIGSLGNADYAMVDGKPQVIKGKGIFHLDDKQGKPVAIQRHIGRRPAFVGGNSDGDFEMAEWATAGAGPRMAVLVHHTDAVREFAYDRQSPVGALDRGLDEAPQRGWVLVDMARDWNRIWPE